MDERASQTLEAYADLLRQWNRAFNLVSRKDINRLETRHIQDSLRLCELLTERGSVLDIGSGGGLPGLVLAIAEPDRDLTLLDRSEKKCRFLHQAVAELALTNAAVICADASSFQPAQPFRYVVSRAVADVDQLWKWAEPLLVKQGKMLHMTGEQQISERVRG